MNRVKRIFTRGWLSKAVSVLTFGYYPAVDSKPVVKIRFSFSKRSMVVTMAKKSIVFSFLARTILFATAQRRLAFGLTRRRMTFALSGRTMTFSFIGNELG